MVSTNSLTIDTSLVGYVLGDTPQVSVSSFAILDIFEASIQRLKPQLKYLQCFRPLTELLNGGILVGCATRRTDIALVEFFDGISERTKAIEIQTLENADAGTISVRKSLLLSEDGEIIIWYAVYDRPIGSDDHCRMTGGRDEVTREAKFGILDREKLSMALSQSYLWNVNWGKLFLKILTRLSREIGERITEREGHVQNMKDARVALDNTISRIQV
jgi:hypothetical protein